MNRWLERLHTALTPPGLMGLLLASFVLLSAWSLAVPIFEAPDEPDHWQYAVYLRQHLSLPVYGPEFIEANSPPLYYAVIAPFAISSDLPRRLDLSRLPPSRVPRFQHSLSDFSRYWPLRVSRLVTALISTVTVLFCYWAGFEASRRHTVGLLAAGLVACLPQFTFRGMNISNDAMVTMLCAVALYLIVRMIQRGFTWPSGLATSVVLALAFLSKISAIWMPVSCALAILSERAPWRTRISRLGVFVPGLVIAAPWVIRNQVLYGDPFASRAMLTAVSDLVAIKPLASEYFVAVFPWLLVFSFIGGFGWMSLWMPFQLYALYGILFLVSAICFAVGWFRRDIDRRLAGVLLTMPVMSFLIVVNINLTFDQPQGRYLFPALPALAVIGAVGLESIPAWSKWSTLALLSVLALLNVYILAGVVIPAYWLTTP